MPFKNRKSHAQIPKLKDIRYFTILSSGALDWGGPGGVANWTVSFQKRTRREAHLNTQLFSN